MIIGTGLDMLRSTSMEDPLTSKPAVNPGLFALDPQVVFLNHGSFGSCPLEVLDYQNELRLRLERQPVRFLQRELESRMDKARSRLAEFIGSDADDLVFVSNATSGVNTVLRSIDIQPGDELLVTDHEYNACRNALNYSAEKNGAKVVTISLPFPLKSKDEVIEAVLSHVSVKTRLLLIDHVTSPTALVLPVAEIVKHFEERGIETLVDGAHAPGMIPLNMEQLGATYYTGNCHKWICAPKSAGFLYVRRDRQKAIRPLAISHGANSPRTDRSRFQIEFAWTGTRDPSAILSVPHAIDTMSRMVSGGWSAVMERNRALALAARNVLCLTFNLDSPAPEDMIGSMAAVPLPDSTRKEPASPPLFPDHWQDELMARCQIEVPMVPWPHFPRRLVRVSAQLYNSLPQYDLLAEGIKELVDDQV